jgi:hypothetical protein
MPSAVAPSSPPPLLNLGDPFGDAFGDFFSVFVSDPAEEKPGELGSFSFGGSGLLLKTRSFSLPGMSQPAPSCARNRKHQTHNSNEMSTT